MIFEENEIKQIEAISQRLLSKLKESLQIENKLSLTEAMEYLDIKDSTTLYRRSKKYNFNIYGLGKNRYCFKSEINRAIKQNPLN